MSRNHRYLIEVAISRLNVFIVLGTIHKLRYTLYKGVAVGDHYIPQLEGEGVSQCVTQCDRWGEGVVHNMMSR